MKEGDAASNMTIEERIDAHDRQIEALIKLASKQSETAAALTTVAEHNIAEIEALRATVADLTRQWQA